MSRRSRAIGIWTLLSLGMALAGAGCRSPGLNRLDRPDLDVGSQRSGSGGGVPFRDVTAAAGIHFQHNNGARGQKLMPETMGSGCAFLDYDNDGREDILFLDGAPVDGSPIGSSPSMKLYHNDGGGHFTDVTGGMGLSIPMAGMGVAVGDYDGDGWDDLFITAVGHSHLFHNDRGRRFDDVTATSGIRDSGWPTSAAWLDFDRDGRLDLFVCHYIRWSPAIDLEHAFSVDGIHKSYATPEPFEGESCRLYHNDGSGHFTDESARTGILSSHSKALSVTPFDYNGDGWPDLFVANDTQPNFLFENMGDSRFRQVGLEAAVAVSAEGKARAGMGCAAADYDDSGRLSLGVSNFSGEQLALYHNDGGGLFSDRAAQAGIGAPSERFLGFGLLWIDVDLDGLPDLFVNNGHVMDDIGQRSADVAYQELPLLFHNDGSGRFHEATAACGPALDSPRVGRGAARGDFDNDGRPDILLVANNGSAHLFRNAGQSPAHWIGLKLIGRESNRDGYGATLLVHRGPVTRFFQCASAGSYLSSMDPRVLIGLGPHLGAVSLEIRWPSGRVQKIGSPPLDQYSKVNEP